jgi:hypothetical protein
MSLISPLSDPWPRPASSDRILSITRAMSAGDTLAFHKPLTKSTCSSVKGAPDTLSGPLAVDLIGSYVVFTKASLFDGVCLELGGKGIRTMGGRLVSPTAVLEEIGFELNPVSAEAVDTSGLVEAESCEEGGFGVEIDAGRRSGALEMIDIDSVVYG